MIRILVVLMATLLPTTAFVSWFDTLPTHGDNVTLESEPQASSFVAVTTLSTSFKQPAAVTVAPTGDVYVADTAHHQIRAIRTDGRVEILAGSGTPGMRDGNGAEAQLASPRGIVFDSTREVIYVADTGNHAIRKVTRDGTVTTVAGNGSPGRSDGGGVSAAFKSPTALAFDPMKDILYVADTGNSSIRAVTSLAAVTTVLAGLKQPEGLALDRDGTLYIADTMNHMIRKLTANGASTVAGSGLPGFLDGTAAEARFHEPVGIGVTEEGEIVVADRLNHRLRVIDAADGSVHTLSGIGQPAFLDGDPASAGFHEPAGVALSGALWVADEANNAVRMLVPELRLTRLNPARGPLEGGEVRITGSGFIPGRTTVTFGGVIIESDVISSTELRAEAPPAMEGSVDVQVTTPAGARVLTDAYTYVAPPQIYSVQPAVGSLIGATSVTVRGAHFDDKPQVYFGERRADVISATASELIAVAPPSSTAGAIDVQVITTGGTASLSDAFRYVAPPRIDSFTPSEGFPNDWVTIVGSDFEPFPSDNAVTLDHIRAAVISASRNSIVVAVPPNAHSGAWSVTTIGGSATSSALFVVPTITSLVVTPTSSTVAVGDTQQLTASVTYSTGKTEAVTSSAVWTSDKPDIASVDQSGRLSAIASGTATVTAAYKSFTSVAHIQVKSLGPTLPPDPAATATPVDPTIATSFATSVSFLYRGPSPVQFDVAENAISEQRAAVVRGRVVTSGDQPLSGVLVTVHAHPELGHTLTRADGQFDLVVNGGGAVVVAFDKAGYVSAHRRLLTSWNDFAVLDDVRMATYDPAVTTIDLSTLQDTGIARGSTIVDADGARQATLLLEPGTAATMMLADGQTRALDHLSLRVTDLTVGRIGTMPADLPAESAYTYCVDVSADEAIQSNATTVTFTRPVAMYVENFLNLPVGTAIPLGYYDQRQAQWIAQPNGRVVKILSTAAGVAAVDVNGDGAADAADDALIVITESERKALARLYSSGDMLWRAALPHLSVYDENFSWGPPDDAEFPSLAQASALGQSIAGQSCQAGSIIECESLTLGEKVGLPGTPFALQYRSRTAAGNVAERELEISLSKSTVPASLKRIDLTLTIAGQRVKQSFAPQGGQKAPFAWDGRDVYGRLQRSARMLGVKIDYVYDTVYRAPGAIDRAFGYTGSQAIAVTERAETVMTQTYSLPLAGRRPDQGLGGWTLDAIHSYDPALRTLHLGSGTDVVLDAQGHKPELSSVSVPTVRFITTGPDGSIYAAAWQCGAIVRRLPTGVVQTIGGGGSSIPQNGSNAMTSRLCVGEMSVAANGDLVVLDRAVQKIFRVTNGTLALLASVPSTSSNFSLAASPSGSIYFTHQDSLYRIDSGGMVAAVAPATASALYKFVRVGKDGEVYVLMRESSGPEDYRRSVYRWSAGGKGKKIAAFSLAGAPVSKSVVDFAVDSDGRLYYYLTNDGSRLRIVEPDGAPHDYATVRPFLSLESLEIDERQQIVFVDNCPTSGRCVYINDTPAVLTPNGGWIAAIPPGTEALLFDASGRHVETRNAVTGVTTAKVTYDASGLPVGIADIDGLVTTVERNERGQAIAIVASNGERTTLDIDAAGLLRHVVTPGGAVHGFTYDDGGLLTAYSNPRGETSGYEYDVHGRLERATNAAGRTKDLAITRTDSSASVSVTTSEGRTWSYAYTRKNDDDIDRTITLPSGSRVTSSGSAFVATTQQADGTVTRSVRTSDAQWGTMAPLASSTEITLPSGQKMTASRSVALTLASAADPLSVTSMTDSFTVNGRLYANVFTKADRRVRSVSPLGRIVDTYLDARGRPREIRSAGLAPVTISYDDRGRIGTFVQGDRNTVFEWDSHDRLASVTDPLGRTTRFGRDTAGRVVEQLLPGGGSLRVEYDANGNIASVTPPGKSTYRFSYGAADALATDEATGVGAAYNRDGELTGVTRAGAADVSIGYDTAGRMRSIGTTSERHTVSYLSGGQVGNVASSDGASTTHEWDGPLPTRVAIAFGNTNTDVRYGWNSNFQLASESVAGVPVTFTYDADGQLTGAGQLTVIRDTQSGMLTGTTLGSITDSYTYNEFGELASYAARAAGAAVLALGYTRDRGGRITRLNDDTFEYDAAGRLQRVLTDGVVRAEYEYDGNGNRTIHRYRGGAASGTYDSEDQLLAYGDATYTYTPTGDRQTKTLAGVSTLYTYDAMRHLRSVSSQQQTIEYQIDAGGNRRGKSINGVPIRAWLYGGADRVIAELDGAGHVVSRFVYATHSTSPDYMLREGATYRMIHDHLGSPVMVINATTGDVAQQISYDEFGNVESDTNPGFQPFGFAGGLYDTDTGLVHFGARDYDPHVGRFISRDPIGFAGGDSNVYVYAFSDPVNFIDPTGYYSTLDFVEDAANFSAGFGDSLSFGLTNVVRDVIGGNEAISQCSGWYTAGEYTEVAAEIALTAGSGALRRAAADASRTAVRAEFRQMTRGIAREGMQLHHVNPLFGHPGGAATLFPTGGLPGWMHSGRWNLKLLSNAEHVAAHRALRQMETIGKTIVNPGTTAIRAARDANNGGVTCGCQ